MEKSYGIYLAYFFQALIALNAVHAFFIQIQLLTEIRDALRSRSS